MIIIGEKINGTRKSVAKAIRDRDVTFIQALAKSQTEAGSSYLDVNAGTAPDREPDDMRWLVAVIQEASELPLCLDSANSIALKAGLESVNKVPLVNSLSGEKKRIEGILPLLDEFEFELIILALDDSGIPPTSEGRLAIISKLMDLMNDKGLSEEKLFVDPLVTAISTGTENAKLTFDTIKRIKDKYPKCHVTGGLSNISFGMPLRPLINRYFMAMAIQMGLDSAIVNPNDRELREAMMAGELLMGHDRFCMNFNRSFRAGKIGLQAS